MTDRDGAGLAHAVSEPGGASAVIGVPSGVSAPAWLLMALLSFYRKFVSPALGARCRFYPSCSAYALEAVRVHGAARGSWLAMRRLGKCHPFHPGGLDPVPPARRAGGERTAAADPPDLAGPDLAGLAGTDLRARDLSR